MNDLLKVNNNGESNDSSTEAEHSSVTVTLETKSSDVQGTISQIEGRGPEVMGSLMLSEPAQSQSTELHSEANRNIAPPAPAKPPKKSRKRKCKRNCTRKRSLSQITAGDTVTEERAPRREPTAGDTGSSTRGCRWRFNRVQVRPPLYLRLKRDEYEWYFPDYNENEI